MRLRPGGTEITGLEGFELAEFRQLLTGLDDGGVHETFAFALAGEIIHPVLAAGGSAEIEEFAARKACRGGLRKAGAGSDNVTAVAMEWEMPGAERYMAEEEPSTPDTAPPDRPGEAGGSKQQSAT